MDFVSILGWVSTAIDSQVQAVVDWASAGFATLFADLVTEQTQSKADATTNHTAIQAIIIFLDGLWNKYLNPLLNKIWDILCKIQDFLRRILGPLVCLLKWLHCWQQFIFSQYIKPMYDLLQRLRRALVIFRLLGFKWAQALDARIVKMETNLTSAFMAVWANLNLLSNWINYILDPTGIFQPNVWLRSIMQSIGAIIAIATDQMTDKGFVDEAGHYSTPAGYYDKGTMQARIHMRYLTGTLPEDDDCMTSLHASAAAMGYTR